VLYSSQDHLRIRMRDLDHPVLAGVENTDICAFTYHIVESGFVLLYIRSLVLGPSIVVGPQRPTTLIRWKVLDIIANELLE
jgi:hypothetical protein